MDFQTPLWVCEYMVSLIPEGVQTVLEPTKGEGNLVRALNGYEVTSPEDFWSISGVYDCIIANPPFSPMSLGYKILYRCMEMSNRLIFLMPWLVLINSQQRTRDLTRFGLKSVTHLPRSVFKGARVQTLILNLERGYQGETKLFLEV